MTEIMKMMKKYKGIKGVSIRTGERYTSVTFDLRFTNNPRTVLCCATEFLSYCDKNFRNFYSNYSDEYLNCSIFSDSYITKENTIISVDVFRSVCQ